MTEYGCTIDGQPAMPILIAEHTQLVTRAAETEAALDRVRAECDRVAQLDTVTDDDGRADAFSTGARWTLRMIRDALVGPTTVAPRGGTPNETVAAVGSSPSRRWLLEGTRDLSIPQQAPRFTARPVTPEMERAATERARQAAEESERSAAWLAEHCGPHPAEALLVRLVNAPDAAEHAHTVPPIWDGGGPCEYCTALEEARALVAAFTTTKEN